MLRVEFLYAAWSSTVMALVAVSVWDALALDSRDTEIRRRCHLRAASIVRAKVSALLMFAAGFAVALNADARDDPSGVGSEQAPAEYATGRHAHRGSTSPARRLPQLSGSSQSSDCASCCMPSWERTLFHGFPWLYERGSCVALVTTLLLIPAMSFRIATLWLQGTIRTNLLPPLWFVGLHDMMSGILGAVAAPGPARGGCVRAGV